MSTNRESRNPNEPVARCLKYIHKWREYLAHAWVGSLSGAPDVRAVGNAVDDLLSLGLLVEAVRGTSSEIMPPLSDVVASSTARSVQGLWTAVGQSTSSPILKAVFQPHDVDAQVPVPDNVLHSPWPEGIGEALNLMSPTEVPYAFLGDFHQLCLARPLEAAFFHFGALESQRRRRDWGAHYTPTPIVAYLVHWALGSQTDGGISVKGLPPRILDPSCGSGAFLIAAAQVLLRSHVATNLSAWDRLELISRAVYGTDIDGKAVGWARRLLLLAIWESCVQDGLDASDVKGTELPALGRNIVSADFLRFAASLANAEECPVPGPFDAIIGGPPFIRLQDLHRTQPGQISEYRRRFVTAGGGSFDLYMLFIEQSLRLLREGGRLGFSVSNSFLRSTSGRQLRELIAEVATVEEMIEFPDAQVYPDAKVQIVLLCLSKGRSARPGRYAQLRGSDAVDCGLRRLHSVRQGKSTEAGICWSPLERLGGDPWLCGDAESEACSAKVERVGVRLGLLPVEIRSGVSTGADKVFLLQSVRDGPDGSVLVREREYGETFHMESQALRPITRGRDIKAYLPAESTTLCVFPYDKNGEPLTEQALRERFPRAYGYLQSRKDRLMAVQRRKDDPWWVPRFRNPQDMASAPRLVAGKVAFGRNFTLDTRQSTLCHSTVAIVQPYPDTFSPYYLLGILNSVVFWLFTQRRMPAIGPKRYICRVLTLKEFPLVLPESAEQSTCEEIAALARGLCEGSLEARKRQDARSQIDVLAKALYGIP